MADKWSHISCILIKEEEGFKKAMRAEVGITSLCTNNSHKLDFVRLFTGTDIIAQYTEMEESKF